jgi:hypothetical protein
MKTQMVLIRSIQIFHQLVCASICTRLLVATAPYMRRLRFDARVSTAVLPLRFDGHELDVATAAVSVATAAVSVATAAVPIVLR